MAHAETAQTTIIQWPQIFDAARVAIGTRERFASLAIALRLMRDPSLSENSRCSARGMLYRVAQSLQQDLRAEEADRLFKWLAAVIEGDRVSA